MYDAIRTRLRDRLPRLYGDQAAAAQQLLLDELAPQLERLANSSSPPRSATPRWSQRDAVLITYADQVRCADESPLRTLCEFLTARNLHSLINTVHLLPFFPYTSDDGFSVVDFRQVDPAVGDWGDLESYTAHFQLMFDFVLNHTSVQCAWFKSFLSGEAPCEHFYVEADPAADLSAVVRPRSHPLLTEFAGSNGPRHVWTTFSADQVDLNYAEPAVLAAMLGVLLDYVERGARIIRLDAIAFLWKELGTSCLHLSQTHEVVKLMRDVLEVVSPEVILLTETNVPHEENLSYLGDGDEAHMVYQFSLPPLLLDALLHGDATTLRGWLANLSAPQRGTTYFNFTASHDGIGVRPLEGIVPDSRLEQLVETTRARGGRVGMRRSADGTEKPYELNITYVDALGASPDAPADLHAARFLASQAVMLSLQGIPGIYFHSLVGSRNDQQGVQASGIARRINRRKFDLAELNDQLDTCPLGSRIFAGYQRLLRARVTTPAFHPDASQEVVDAAPPSILAFLRTPGGDKRRVLVLANLSAETQAVPLYPQLAAAFRRDLLGGDVGMGRISLAPYQVMWLTED